MAQNDRIVVGIDVAKDKVDACIRSLSQRQAFPSAAEGHRKLVAWLRKHKVAKAVMTELKPNGVNLLQANGAGAGQSVPHLHIHIMPRRPNDGVALNWEYKPGDKAEIEAIYKRLKAAL